jgi:hypothetical protein
VDIGATAAQELKDMYNKLTEDRIGAAMKDVWERLLTPLKNLSMKLDYEAPLPRPSLSDLRT